MRVLTKRGFATTLDVVVSELFVPGNVTVILETCFSPCRNASRLSIVSGLRNTTALVYVLFSCHGKVLELIA